MINDGCVARSWACCAEQSEFLRGAGRRGSADRGARRLKTARAWPWAAQQKSFIIVTNLDK